MRVAAGALLAILTLSAPAEARVTIDDLMRLRSVSDVQISPDGRTIAYVVSTPSFEQAAHVPVLYTVARTGGTPTQLTYTTQIFNRPLPAPNLRWSPDGSQLAFIALIDDVPQVVAMRATGGEPRPITSVADGVRSYEWAPDSRRIAFIAPDPPSADEIARKKDKSYVTHVDRDQRPPRLRVQRADGGPATALTPPAQTVLDFDWSPDGTTIVYAASNENSFFTQYRSRLYTIAADGGSPRALVDRPGMNHGPRFSPDGKWVAFVSTGGETEFTAAEDLHVIAADGRRESLRNLTAAREVWIGEFTWMRDSTALLYLAHQQTNGSGAHMFEQPIMRVPLDGGAIESLTPGPVVNYSLTVSRDGSLLAFRSVESRTMGDVYVMETATRKLSRLTEINPELKSMALGELKPISWRSVDGQEIWGLLLTPPGYRSDRRIPLVVYCHGGPIGGVTYGLFPQFAHRVGQVDPYPSEAMASAGMAVLFPMPRGGSGYGTKGLRAIINAWGEIDYKDIMTGVDAVIARGIADPDRLGVMGASYGGFMTSWIVTQTDRFKAASTGASVNDLAQMYYLSNAGDFIVDYFGLPWEAAASLAAHSPLTHAAKVTTPLLIQHGERDFRVPLGQAQAFYKALKALGKTVEFDIYPRGGHVNYEPPLEREYMRRNLAWFERWLKPGGTN